MLPPRARLDPEGYYAALGLDPASTREAITAAFRRKAREVHPDVPVTGDAHAFVAIRRAYDVLSHPDLRETYDQAARQAAASAERLHEVELQETVLETDEPEWLEPVLTDRPLYRKILRLVRQPRFFDVPLAVWIGLGVFLGLGIFEAGLHLHSAPAVVNAGIKPNAVAVAPLSPSAQRAELYGPAPVRLAGVPNFYVIPASGAAVLWRKDTKLDTYVPFGQLPAFSTVQALRLYRQNGLVEIQFNETTTSFIDSKRLAPGDADAARRAYCGYNAGPAPYDGELLEQRGQGSATLQLENRSIQPVVVKLRDTSGAVAVSAFLGPGGHANLVNVPHGTFRPEFAVGELWSRACNVFAAGMRARRLEQTVTTPSDDARLIVPPDQETAAADISDQTFADE